VRLLFAIDNFKPDALMTFQSLVAKLSVVGATFISLAAQAQVIDAPGGLNRVPEPETLALFALAAAIGAIVSRKRK
jgi:hypothetical protein